MKKTLAAMKNPLAAAALALLLAATGPARAAPPDIIIGAPNSLTGGLGESGRYVVNGLQLAIDQINAAGGIKSLGGARLKVIPADTTTDNPQQAASVTRRLITEDHAVILVGAHASTMTLSAQIEAERGGVPIITTSFADQLVQRGYKYTFKVPAQVSVFSKAAMDDAIRLFADAGRPLKRFAVFNSTDAANVTNGKVTVDYIRNTPGLELVTALSLPVGLSDPTPIVRPVREGKPDMIAAYMVTTDLVVTLRALRSLNVNSAVLATGSAITVKSIPEALGRQANYFMGTVAWNDDLPISGVKEFVAAFLKAYPDQKYAPQEAGEGYAIGQLIGQALEKAASTDPTKIRDVLSTISVPTVMPGGPIEFDPTGLNKHSIPVMVEWQDGVLHTIWPKEYQARPPQFP